MHGIVAMRENCKRFKIGNLYDGEKYLRYSVPQMLVFLVRDSETVFVPLLQDVGDDEKYSGKGISWNDERVSNVGFIMLIDDVGNIRYEFYIMVVKDAAVEMGYGVVAVSVDVEMGKDRIVVGAPFFDAWL